VLDLLIRDAEVVDGTGAPAFRASVGVVGDRIVWVGRGDPPPPEAVLTVAGAGRVVAPGFVDVHSHSDLVPLVEPWMDSALRMGCTSVVVGNCGSSPWPRAGAAEMASLIGVSPGDLDMTWRSFDELLARLDAAGPAVNVAALVGHGAMRLEALGIARSRPTDDEVRRMQRAAREAVEAGAFGLSTGLIYVPGIHSRTEELVAVAEAIAPLDPIYASHIRGEGRDLFVALAEAIAIGERAGIRAHVSHLKCETDLVWGRAGDALAALEGHDVTADQYPYTAWASSLASLLPDWAPVEELASLIADPVTSARLTRAIEEGEPGFQSSVLGVGWDHIVVESSGEDRWRGRDLADVAAEMDTAPVLAMIRLLLREPETSVIGHAMHEEDVRTVVADPEVMVASDSSAMSPQGPLGAAPVHPRTYGTFPRVLGHYVREERLLTLEAAIRTMTSLPADRFGLRERGRIGEGGFADLVVLNPATVDDTATFEAPHRFPTGIDLVVVNGVVAWDGDRGARAGRVLRRR
jgi:N-acyl-D-amino-acid deacylase